MYVGLYNKNYHMMPAVQGFTMLETEDMDRIKKKLLKFTMCFIWIYFNWSCCILAYLQNESFSYRTCRKYFKQKMRRVRNFFSVKVNRMVMNCVFFFQVSQTKRTLIHFSQRWQNFDQSLDVFWFFSVSETVGHKHHTTSHFQQSRCAISNVISKYVYTLKTTEVSLILNIRYVKVNYIIPLAPELFF